MKYIRTFESYIIQEYSKNSPIPELYSNDKPLAIFLMGSPASGKSTFIKNFIQTRKLDIKTFSSDDISLMFTKNPNIRHRGSGELNIRRIDMFIETGQSFVYDTTPTYSEEKVDVVSRAKDNGYEVIFIAIISTLDTAIKRNQQRQRQSSEDFLRHSYNTFWNNIKSHKELSPDSFYLITNLDNKYSFYKYNGNSLTKKKGEFYV